MSVMKSWWPGDESMNNVPVLGEPPFRFASDNHVLACAIAAAFPVAWKLPLLTFRPPYVPPSNRISQTASWKAAELSVVLVALAEPPTSVKSCERSVLLSGEIV